MSILFLWYPRCTTAQKAKKWLDEKQITYEMRDMIKDNPTHEELNNWYKKSNLPLKKFFNTSGMKYRELKLKDKLKTASEEEMLDLLSSDGMLVKRPILITDEAILIGFKEAEWSNTLL
jgi:arsenate reductase